MKKGIALLLALVMLVSIFAGCAKKEETPAEAETPEATEEKTTEAEKPEEPAEEEKESEEAPAEESAEDDYLKIQLPLNDTLSGLKSTFINGIYPMYQWMFDTLMRYDTDTGEFIPALAEKLDISEDGLVYTVTLRDATFHDGTPITADDVVFTFTTAICGSMGRVSKLSAIEGFEAASAGEADTVSGIQKVDDKTVTFTLTQPNSVFVEALANGTFGIIPSAYFEGMTAAEINEDAAFWEKPVGSGAYYVSETAYPNYIVLTAYPDYYEPSGIETIVATYYADKESANTALIAGELDYIIGLEEEAATNVLNQNPDLVGIPMDTSYHRWFLVNTSGTAGDQPSHPSLQNPRVRHAIDMLLDKDAICQLYGSLASPLTTHVNSNSPEYNSDIPTWTRDVEGAKQILEEENFDFDTPIRIYSHYTNQITADFMELVVQNLAEGGVQATYTMDNNSQAYLESANYDFRYMATSSMLPTAFYEMNSIAGLSTTIRSSYPEGAEFEAYQKARYDDLITAYKATLDPAEQKEIMDQLQYNGYEDMYDINLYSVGSYNIYSSRWTGMPVFSSDYSEVAAYKFSNWKLN